MTKNQTVELLLANVLDEYAASIEAVPPSLRSSLTSQRLAENIGRRVLCSIAHNARPEIVNAALAASGIAGGVDSIGNRLGAILEARTEEAKRFGATTATGTPRSADVCKETADAVACFLRSLFPEANISIEPASSS